MRHPALLLLVLAACGEGGVVDVTDAPDTDTDDALPDTDPPAGPPNVLVLVLDDLGVDQVGVYGLGSRPPSTPTLDGLAAQGLRFEHAYAYPSCSPARAALLTGRYGRRTGVGRTVEADEAAWRLPDVEVGLPEMLRSAPEAPYTAALFGKWHLASGELPDVQQHPGAMGFDTWHFTPFNVPDYFRWSEIRDDGFVDRSGYLTSAVVDDTLEFVAGAPEPWIAWVGFHAGHTPWHAPPAALLDAPLDDDASDLEMYRAMVSVMDREIARLLAGLDPDVRARTVIVAVGDNGTHGLLTRAPFDPFGAKLTLHEGGVRVPMIWVGPGIPRGEVAAGLVHFVDVFPTLAELAGVDLSAVPDLGELDGESLVGVFTDPSASVRDVVYTESFGPNGSAFPHNRVELSVRDARWRFLVDSYGTYALYDVAAQGGVADGPDLLKGAGENLEGEPAAALERLQAALADWAVRFGFEPAPTDTAAP